MSVKVTAICVSHASRFGLLQQSLLSFAKQTYENKELIVIVNQPGYWDTINAFLADPRAKELLGNVNIQVLNAAYTNTFEGARMAASRTTGELLVCWDDDDLSHPDRLSFQVKATLEAGVPTVFSEALYHFHDTEEVFVTNFAQPAGVPSQRCASSSLMLARTAIPINTNGNYLPWAGMALDGLAQSHTYQFLSGYPEYFMVGSNGDNWRGADFHRATGTTLPGVWRISQLNERGDDVQRWLSSYAFKKGAVTVSGRDGSAFELTDLPAVPVWFKDTAPPENWRDCIPNLEFRNKQRLEREQANQRNLGRDKGNA